MNQVEQGKDNASRNTQGIIEDLEFRGHPNNNSYKKLVTNQPLCSPRKANKSRSYEEPKQHAN
jgi:hypothetical protein